MYVWNMCSLDRNESESLRKCVAKLKLWHPRNPTNIAWKFIQPMYLLRETHFSCLLRFFTRSPFILTFLYPYGLDSCSFQVKMTCPVVISVSNHVVFFVRKVAKSKKLSRRPKEHHPEAAGHYYNSWESSGTLRCLTTWSNLLEWDSGLVIEEWLTRSDER